MPKSFVAGLGGNLSADARVPDVYFGWCSDAHGRSRAKTEAGFEKRRMMCHLGRGVDFLGTHV